MDRRVPLPEGLGTLTSVSMSPKPLLPNEVLQPVLDYFDIQNLDIQNLDTGIDRLGDVAW